MRISCDGTIVNGWSTSRSLPPLLQRTFGTSTSWPVSDRRRYVGEQSGPYRNCGGCWSIREVLVGYRGAEYWDHHGGGEPATVAWSRGTARVANAAIPMVPRGQSVSTRNVAHQMLSDDALLRVDATVPEGTLRLDGVTPDELRGRAEHVSRRISARFLERFGGHVAAPYLPLTG